MPPGSIVSTLILACLLSGMAERAHGQRIDEFPVANGASDIVRGPDGALWFVEAIGGSIGRLTITGESSRYPFVDHLQRLTWGPDGNLWFTQSFVPFFRQIPPVAAVGKMTPSGVVTRYLIPNALSFPSGIAAGPDGNLWFTESSRGIGRITPDGHLTEFPLRLLAVPLDIVPGPDGNLWFTESDRIGRITLSGEVAEFPLPRAGVSPHSLTPGPDGNLWFTARNSEGVGLIGRITMEGAVSEFPYQGSPDGIVLGPDGNLWFTANSIVHPFDGRIGRITPTGSITEVLALEGIQPGKIVAGPDGNLWFTEGYRGIGRLTIQTTESCAPDSTTLCLSGGRFRADVSFRTAVFPESPGNAVSLSPDAGAFWFFSSGNLEVIVKVVDGRPVNDRFWVFVAGLTDVEYELTVTDTFTGAVWTHGNRAGTLRSVADTSAFGR